MTKPDCDNSIYLELRRIYCCKGAEFCRPTLEKAWKEIERLLYQLQIHQELSDKGANWAAYAMELKAELEPDRTKQSLAELAITLRESLIAEFAYKCCEKGENIDMMWFRLRQIFAEDKRSISK
jgi:hypothetical protein